MKGPSLFSLSCLEQHSPATAFTAAVCVQHRRAARGACGSNPSVLEGLALVLGEEAI